MPVRHRHRGSASIASPISCPAQLLTPSIREQLVRGMGWPVSCLLFLLRLTRSHVALASPLTGTLTHGNQAETGPSIRIPTKSNADSGRCRTVIPADADR